MIVFTMLQENVEYVEKLVYKFNEAAKEARQLIEKEVPHEIGQDVWKNLTECISQVEGGK